MRKSTETQIDRWVTFRRKGGRREAEVCSLEGPFGAQMRMSDVVRQGPEGWLSICSRHSHLPADKPALLRLSPQAGSLEWVQAPPAAILFELLICLANTFSINNEQVNCKLPLRNYYELGVNGV